jgi:hypothetical protein
MLQAWDPVKQEAAWSVPQDHPWNAGTLTTAGNLVFQGRYDGMFLAYDATTGEELWEYDLGLGISAPPITYKLNGTQYIALLVGYGGAITMGFTPGLPDEGWAYGVHTRRLVAFALDGDTSLPKQPPPYVPEPLVYTDFQVDEALANQGARIYGTYCGICHGGGAVANAMAPDLRASCVRPPCHWISSPLQQRYATARSCTAPCHLLPHLKMRTSTRCSITSGQSLTVMRQELKNRLNKPIACGTSSAAPGSINRRCRCRTYSMNRRRRALSSSQDRTIVSNGPCLMPQRDLRYADRVQYQ